MVRRGETDMRSVMPVVSGIIEDIRARGDEALAEQIEKFDRWRVQGDLAITQEQMSLAYEGLTAELKNALQVAYERIYAYHEKQLERSWFSFDPSGAMLGQKITPVDRAGLYIPGGKAAYPSSLLMNAIPAIVAGVEDISVCTPAVGGVVNELLLAAMHVLGIKKAYKVGGASAIAAMAYGTRTIGKVDVITGATVAHQQFVQAAIRAIAAAQGVSPDGADDIEIPGLNDATKEGADGLGGSDG